MKFYYNGKLVRTSKNHHYTHAVLNEKDCLVACSSRKDLAQKVIDSYISECRSSLRNCLKAVKALEQGKTYYICEYNRRSYPVKFRSSDTVEKWKEYIEDLERRIEYYQTNWRIVELEER